MTNPKRERKTAKKAIATSIVFAKGESSQNAHILQSHPAQIIPIFPPMSFFTVALAKHWLLPHACIAAFSVPCMIAKECLGGA